MTYNVSISLYRPTLEKDADTKKAFMNRIAAKAGEERHHPEWSNVYNKTHITWTTHRPRGLSGKDIVMARYCDDVAQEMGEVDCDGK